MELELKGKRVLITGASQGIGEDLAFRFGEEGCDLFLAARSEDKLTRIGEEIRSKYKVNVDLMACDLAKSEATEAVSREAGDIDILINNAGKVPSGSLFEVDEESWRKGWDLKVYGYINLTRCVYPKMKQRGGGVIINNIGNGGEVFDPFYVAGTTANAALMAFTRAMGGNSLADGIRIVGVNPGPVDTDRIRSMLKKRAATWFGDESRFNELMESYPLGRPARVQEVSDLILFLASARSAYVSGAIVTIDGGIASRHSIM